MRKHPTLAESSLWAALRVIWPRQWRRQVVLHGFIADFYHPRAHLALEVDGGIHQVPAQARYDTWRDRVLADYDVTTLRFSNEQVILTLPQVVTRVERALSTIGCTRLNRRSNPKTDGI